MALAPIGRLDGLLACTCWCERTIVHVTKQQVWDGVTLTCGRFACQDPAIILAILEDMAKAG